MYQLVESYRQSGKSQKEFCSQAGIGLAKLNYWIRRYGEHRQPASGFIKLAPLSVEQQQQDLEIFYPNGVRLKASAADLSLISQLIHLC